MPFTEHTCIDLGAYVQGFMITFGAFAAICTRANEFENVALHTNNLEKTKIAQRRQSGAGFT